MKPSTRLLFLFLGSIFSLFLLLQNSTSSVGFFIDNERASSCFELLKNTSSEIPFSDYEEFKKNAKLIYPEEIWEMDVKTPEKWKKMVRENGFYALLVWMDGERYSTSSKFIYGLSNISERMIIFSFTNEGLISCSYFKIVNDLRNFYISSVKVFFNGYPFIIIHGKTQISPSNSVEFVKILNDNSALVKIRREEQFKFQIALVIVIVVFFILVIIGWKYFKKKGY